MDGGIKKWFMLQVWRMQQVAQIITLLLLALNLALQLYGFMTWRKGLFESPYTAIPTIVLALGLLIWAFAIFWDLRMKMWREQVTVTMEKNPYAKEKMTSTPR
jgi:membrane protein YdbS with pleckstrin-like domain